MRAKNVFPILFLTALLYSCQETNPIVPDAYTINGRITFVDSNFTIGGNGQYIVYAWPEPIWNPLGGNPASSQVIDIVKQNNKYVLQYQYRMASVPSGTYVAALMYSDGATFFKVLGVYSCTVGDSACYQVPSRYATIVTTEGLLDIDISANADTSAAIP